MANFNTTQGELNTLFLDDAWVLDRFVGNGTLWAWGLNTYGNLGTGNIQKYSSPVQVSGSYPLWKLLPSFCGGHATAATNGCRTMHAVRKDGTLWGWGAAATYGNIGDGTVVAKSTPVQISAGGTVATGWRQLSIGQHTAAIRADGTLWTWGEGTAGALGSNATTNRSSPVMILGITTGQWKQVAVGANVTLAIKDDSTMWGFGRNNDGELARGNVTAVSSPVACASGYTWKQVAVGGDISNGNHVWAIHTNGDLYAWGANGFGQLGDSTITKKSNPVQISSGGTTWKQVACSHIHSFGIKKDGTLWGCGSNTMGNLGDGTIVPKSSPIQIGGGGTNWKQVATGSDILSTTSFTMAIKTDGTLWGWGINASGQLGDNTSVQKSWPTQVYNGGTNWKQVVCGAGMTHAIYYSDPDHLYPTAISLT